MTLRTVKVVDFERAVQCAYCRRTMARIQVEQEPQSPEGTYKCRNLKRCRETMRELFARQLGLE